MSRANKSPTTKSYRTRPYPTPATPPTSMYQTPTPPGTVPKDFPRPQDRLNVAASTWLAEQDKILMQARQQGENWGPIAHKYFPEKTANACRKRHERLMERRANADSWDNAKLEKLAVAYIDCREQMWKVIGDNIGEKWQVVEAKCMEKGVKTLQNTSRNVAKRSRGESIQPLEHNHSEYSYGAQHTRSPSRDPGSEPDNALGPDYSPSKSAPKRPRLNTNEEDRYPFLGGFQTPNRTFSGSTNSLSVNGVTPIMSAAPFYTFLAPSPIEDTQPRPPVVEYSAHESNKTLPGIEEMVGISSLPSVIAEKRLPRRPPHSPSYGAPVTTAH